MTVNLDLSLPPIPLINGNYPDWSQIDIVLPAPAPRLTGVWATKLSYKHTSKKGEAKGTTQQVLGLTPGEYSAEASLTLHKRAASVLRRSLGEGYMNKQFRIDVNYKMTDTLPMISDRLVGVSITDNGNDHSQGGDSLYETFDLYVLYLLLDGMKPLPNMRL